MRETLAREAAPALPAADDVRDRPELMCLLRPEEQEFRAAEPEQALAWCLVWLMLDELRGAELGRPT